MSLTGPQVDLLAKVLDVTSLRHQVIAENVANVNTPGYRQLDVRFEELVRRALAAGDVPAITRRKPQVVLGPGGAIRTDGNNVDIDAEMARLDKNGLLFRLAAQVLVVQLSQMRSAITGR